MLTGVLKLLTAAAIAFGIVFFVTEGDMEQLRTAANTAYERASDSKKANIATRDAETKPAEPAGPIDVVVQETRSETVSRVLSLTGATEMSRSVELRAETAGIVAIIPSKGARVFEGDLLCRLEIGDRGARRAAAIARLRQAETDMEAQAQLSTRGFAASNAASAARSNAEVLRAELTQMDIEMRRLEIRAPFDGLVESVPVETGAYLRTGDICASLVDPNPLRIGAFVAERNLGPLTVGAPARARLATGERVAGRIAFIAQSADPATRTFELEIEVPNPDYAVRGEVSADLDIPLAGAPASRVPQSALTLNAAGEIGVMVVEAGTARFRPVELIRDDESGAWVSGLSGLARVIVVGQEFVSDGTAVRTKLQSGDILGSDS